MATAMINARIWYDDMELSTQANAVALDYSSEELDGTVFTDTTRTRAGGFKDAQASIAGFWNSVEDKTLFDQVAVNKPLLIASGPTVGDIAYGMVALDSQWTLSGEHGELLGFNVTLNSGNDSAVLVRGELMIDIDLTASGDGTARQLGTVAAATNRVYSGIHVTAFVGTSLDVIVQSDDLVGMGTPLTRITHAQATGLTSEWLSAVGPITDDWWRYNYTFVGTSASFAGIIGIL